MSKSRTKKNQTADMSFKKFLQIVAQTEIESSSHSDIMSNKIISIIFCFSVLAFVVCCQENEPEVSFDTIYSYVFNYDIYFFQLDSDVLNLDFLNSFQKRDGSNLYALCGGRGKRTDHLTEALMDLCSIPLPYRNML